MTDRGLMVAYEKIETNIAQNVSCSLALTDLNYHLIFTVVDEKKKFYFYSGQFKNKSRGVPITLLTDTVVKVKVLQL